MPLRDPEARKAYQRDYQHRRYHNEEAFRTAHQERTRRCDANAKQTTRELIEAFRQAGCALCGERELCCLTAHHLDPETKDFNVGEATSRKLTRERVVSELAKCICLCANCHAKVHAGRVLIPAHIVSGVVAPAATPSDS